MISLWLNENDWLYLSAVEPIIVDAVFENSKSFPFRIDYLADRS
jgi:hypothetical protein